MNDLWALVDSDFFKISSFKACFDIYSNYKSYHKVNICAVCNINVLRDSPIGNIQIQCIENTVNLQIT